MKYLDRLQRRPLQATAPLFLGAVLLVVSCTGRSGEESEPVPELTNPTAESFPIAGRSYEPIASIAWSTPEAAAPVLDDIGLTILAPNSGPLGQQVDIDLNSYIVAVTNPEANLAVRWDGAQLASLQASLPFGQVFSCADRGDNVIWTETVVRGVKACETQSAVIYFLRWEEGASSFLYSSASLLGTDAKNYLEQWVVISPRTE